MADSTTVTPGYSRAMVAAPDASSLEERLVWIFGSPRSGSTWLLRLLIHPWGLDNSREGIDRSRFRPAGGNVLPVNESYLPMHLAPLRESTVASIEVGGGRLLLNDQRAADPAYFFSDAYRGTWEEGTRRLVLERFAAQARDAGVEHGIEDPVMLIKEPNGSHAADVVARLLPRSRIVFLLRDGRDVVDSMLEADSPGGWRTRNDGVLAITTAEDRLSAVRRQAHLWLIRTIAVERACEAIGPDRWIRVRYEDLLADTEGELTRLDEWLGLERSPAGRQRAVRANRFNSLRNRIRGRRNGVRAASPGLWRTNMSQPEQEALNELIGPKLAELGYPL